MTTPKTVKIKRNYHSESDLTESREKNPWPALGQARSFQFEQQAVKKWHLAVAYSLIWLVVSATFIVLYGVDITTGTISQKFFTIRLALIFGTLISAVLLSILLHLYFHKLKLLEERDRLIAEIRDDLAQIRTLRGLLPVCSYCKKVRNDKGYWEQIERYVTNNSHAEFTHGICPECVASLQKDQMEIRFLEVAMSPDK